MHNVDLEDKHLGQAMIEIAEDKIADVLRHHRKTTVGEAKSTITLKIAVMPDSRAESFKFSITSGVSFAPERGYEATIFGRFGPDNEPEIIEYNPKQERLEFDDTKTRG